MPQVPRAAGSAQPERPAQPERIVRLAAVSPRRRAPWGCLMPLEAVVSPWWLATAGTTISQIPNTARNKLEVAYHKADKAAQDMVELN